MIEKKLSIPPLFAYVGVLFLLSMSYHGFFDVEDVYELLPIVHVDC
jgi:hypothetical protein